MLIHKHTLQGHRLQTNWPQYALNSSTGSTQKQPFNFLYSQPHDADTHTVKGHRLHTDWPQYALNCSTGSTNTLQQLTVNGATSIELKCEGLWKHNVKKSKHTIAKLYNINILIHQSHHSLFCVFRMFVESKIQIFRKSLHWKLIYSQMLHCYAGKLFEHNQCILC